MAMLARAYADDPETGRIDVDEAVKLLFKSASYQKRSYIRAFADLVRMLEKYWRFPERIPRGLGVKLRDAIREDPDLMTQVQIALRDLGTSTTPEAELATLRRMAGEGGAATKPSPRGNAPKGGKGARAKTRAAVKRPGGLAIGTARNGRFEILSKEDFTAYEAEDLERAMEAFYAALER